MSERSRRITCNDRYSDRQSTKVSAAKSVDTLYKTQDRQRPIVDDMSVIRRQSNDQTSTNYRPIPGNG